MTYKLCLRLIALGRMDAAKLDVYFAAGRLTADEYEELVAKEGARSATSSEDTPQASAGA